MTPKLSKAQRLLLVAATLALSLGLPTPVAQATDIPWDMTHIIDGSFDGAIGVTTADLDGDGDLDVLGVGNNPTTPADDDTIAWWENDGSGGSWTRHPVETTLDRAQEAHAADMDGDGDLDVLGIAYTLVAYWENDGTGTGWTQRTIGTAWDIRSGYAADLDGDGDTDVLAGIRADGILWWENDHTLPDDGTPWASHGVPAFDRPSVVGAADMDGDGDLDVLGASGYYDVVDWYENTGPCAGTGGACSDWAGHRLGSFTDPNALHAADFDKDGDLDMVGAGTGNGTIGWWENTNGAATAWTYRRLSGAPDRAVSAYPADMDNDGDVDVLGTFDYGGYPNVIWWENDGSPTNGWIQRRVWSDLTGAAGVCAGDLDEDGDLDVIATSNTADTVAWWENVTIHRNATFPLAGEHTVDGAFGGAVSAHATDMDGDGDMDVLGASSSTHTITWWENVNGDGTAWTERTVDGSFQEVVAVYVADVDGDGDTDVLGASRGDADVAWWENVNGAGTAWTKHTVDASFQEPSSVYGADVDGDGDMDVLGASRGDADVTWWENTNRAGTAWTKHMVDGSFDQAISVRGADVDGDGDMDVVANSEGLGAIWWENDGSGGGWIAHEIDEYALNWSALHAADMDGDGDTDVLGSNALSIVWCENDNGAGTVWWDRNVSGIHFNPTSVYAADMDGDGDMDVVSAATGFPIYPLEAITWWENTNGAATAWTEHTIDGSFYDPVSVYAADVDGDGDMDVLGASTGHADIAWWQNRGGQFGLDTADTAPAGLVGGERDDLLRITVRHNGRAGDGDIELSSLALLFEEGAGDPLTSAEANALVASLHIYRDNGSGGFEAGSDTLVTSVDTLALTNGVQTVVFADGDTDVQVPLGAPRMFFVVVESTGDAAGQTPFQLRITHLTQSGSAQDRDHDLPVSLEYAPNTASGVTIFLANTIYLAPDALTCAGNNPCVTTSQRVLDRLNNDGTLVILATNDISETLTSTGRNVTIVGDAQGALNWESGAGNLLAIAGWGTTTLSGTLTLSCSGNCAGSTAFHQSGGTLNTTHITVTGFDDAFNQTGGTLTAHNNTLSGTGTGTAFGSSGTVTAHGNTITGFANMFVQIGGTLTAYDHTLSGSGTAFQAHGTTTVYSTTLTGFDNGFDHSGGTLIAHSNTLSGTTTAFRLNGSATVYGNTAIGCDTAFDLSDATLTAYANNLDTPVTALAWTGSTWNLKHNWWGTALGSTPPAGLDQLSWLLRLGAPVESWASGDGGAALGGAQLAGGTGTAVIVGHGRSPADAPFGVEVAPAAEMCSDYYDFFTVGGGGLWTVSVPVDDNAACDTVYAGRELLWALDTTQCTPGSTTCYDPVPGVGQEAGPPRQLVLADVPTNYLYGTLSVAGSEDVNDPPTAVDDTATTDEDSPITIDVLVNDDDDKGTPVVAAFDASSAQGQVTDNGDGTFDYDPNGQFEHLDSGQQAFDVWTYVISDTGSLTATATVTTTVTGINDGPTISDISHQLKRPGILLGPVSFGVNDVDDAPETLALTGVSSNPALVDDSSIVFGGYGANRTVLLAPAPGVTGTATITVTVSDGDLSDYDTFVLSVEVNSPPEFTCSPVTTATVGTPYTYTITARDLDADDALTITATTTPDWLTLTQVTSRTATLSGTPAGAGRYPIVLQAADGEDTDTQSFIVDSTGYVYLPLIVSSYAAAPDLVMDAADNADRQKTASPVRMR